jgi:O-antigen ligase
MMGSLDHTAVGAIPLERTSRKIKSVDFLANAAAVLIGIFVFFNPFPHTTAIKEISLYSSLFTVLILVLFMKRDFALKSPFTLPFLLFLIWAIIGIYFTLDQSNTIHDIYTHYIKYLFLYYILFNFYQSEKRFIFLAWIIILSASLFSIGGLIYFYGIQNHHVSDRFGFIEMSINYLCLPTISALLFSLHLYQYQAHWIPKAILVLAAASTLAATLLTQTRGALIAVIISVVLLFIDRKKIIVTLLVGLGIIIMIIPNYTDRFSSKHPFANERIAMNRLTCEIIKDYPIAGIGFGMMIYANPEFLDSYEARLPEEYRSSRYGSDIPVPSPHNIFLDVTVRTGFVGLAAFMFIVGTFVQVVWKLTRRGQTPFARDWGRCLFASFCAIIIQALFMDITFGPQAVVFYTTIAMLSILWQLNKAPEGTPVGEERRSWN